MVIDRGQPKIIGDLSADEVKSIRSSVRSLAVRFPFYVLLKGELSAAWYYTKEAYTYRIVTIELIDTNMTYIYTATKETTTMTNTYPRGRLRPSFGARKTNGAWEVARNWPML